MCRCPRKRPLWRTTLRRAYDHRDPHSHECLNLVFGKIENEMLSDMKCLLFAILPILLLSACANPSITNLDKAGLSASANAPIYVPRFEGRPDFVEEATDMFVATLRQKISRQIIQGDVLRGESTDVLRGGNIAPRQVGLEAAQAAGAGLLILGKVTSHKTDAMLNGFVTIRILDVKSGVIIGTIHRPSGLLVGHSEHQCVMTASKRVAGALASQF
jgi:hypothetical protein